MLRKPWCSEEDEYIKKHYDRLPLYKIAENLNRSERCIKNHYKALVEKGEVDNHKRLKPPIWTKEEDEILKTLIGRNGIGCKKAAELLERSVYSIRTRLHKLKIKNPVIGPTQNAMSLSRVCAIMGVSDASKSVRRWVKSGALKSTRKIVDLASASFAIYPADLIEFLKNHPEKYDKSLMPRYIDGEVNVYRQYAISSNPFSDYIHIKKIAAICNVKIGTARMWARKGRIKAYHLDNINCTSNEYFVHKNDIEGIKSRIKYNNSGKPYLSSKINGNKS